MKTFLGILVVGLLVQTSSLAQLQLVRITQYQRDGTLSWTNRLCTTRPVYQVLRALAVTGPWVHVAYVTNATSYRLAKPIPDGRTAFYRILWTDDVPVVMDYEFDEYGVGIPSVYGQLTLNFSSLSASWFFEEDPDFHSGSHPLGAGFGPIGATSDLQTWVVLLRRNIDDQVFLSGSLGSSSTASGCQYTYYAGLVYWDNFGGRNLLGEFVAVTR